MSTHASVQRKIMSILSSVQRQCIAKGIADNIVLHLWRKNRVSLFLKSVFGPKRRSATKATGGEESRTSNQYVNWHD